MDRPGISIPFVARSSIKSVTEFRNRCPSAKLLNGYAERSASSLILPLRHIFPRGPIEMTNDRLCNCDSHGLSLSSHVRGETGMARTR